MNYPKTTQGSLFLFTSTAEVQNLNFIISVAWCVACVTATCACDVGRKWIESLTKPCLTSDIRWAVAWWRCAPKYHVKVFKVTKTQLAEGIGTIKGGEESFETQSFLCCWMVGTLIQHIFWGGWEGFMAYSLYIIWTGTDSLIFFSSATSAGFCKTRLSFVSDPEWLIHLDTDCVYLQIHLFLLQLQLGWFLSLWLP